MGTERLLQLQRQLHDTMKRDLRMMLDRRVSARWNLWLLKWMHGTWMCGIMVHGM